MNYPIMLNLEGKSCVVVGGGRVATRKVAHLLDAARITVISPDITETLQQWQAAGRIECLQQSYCFEALSRYAPNLVFAATDSQATNQVVANDAARLGAWCNIVDNPDISDFHNMAVVAKPPITIAISTQGTSPVLLKRIKADIEQFLGEEYSILAIWLKNLRETAKNQIETQSERHDLYESIVQSDILDLLRDGRETIAREHFDALVEKAVS